MNIDHLGGGIIATLLIFATCMFWTSMAAFSVEHDCQNIGKTRINGHVYECRLLGDEVKP